MSTRSQNKLVRGLTTLALLIVAAKSGHAQRFADMADLEPPLIATKIPTRTPFNPATRPDVLDLESSLQRADLVVAAKLVEVTESKVVQGGRNVQVTQQFRFETLRIVKGIFTREALLMTGSDLGVYPFAAAGDRLKPGQTCLILLARNGQSFMNCNPAATLEQSIPRLSGVDDPLLATVDVLIEAARRNDRKARVNVLLAGLRKAKGREAGPLLLALERRAGVAARNNPIEKQAEKIENRESVVGRAVLPFLKSDSASLRELAAYTIGSVLEATPGDAAMKNRKAAPSVLQVESARAIDAALATAGPDVAARVAMIEARGLTGGESVGLDAAQIEQLSKSSLPKFSSNAEAAARLRAVAVTAPAHRRDEVVRLLESMLLDAPADLQTAAGKALVALDPVKAAELIADRLARKDAAGFDVSADIDLIAELPAASAATALLKAGDRTLSALEQRAFAKASLKSADPRLVPLLSGLLDPRQWNVRTLAIDALRKINTEEAASVVRAHFDEEADPSRKLRLIAFLARHGIHDGDVAAMESLADASLRDDAVNAVVAAGGPKVVAELQKIWRSSNDPNSNAAAFRSLARLGRDELVLEVLAIAKTSVDPLAQPALLALADLGSPEAVPLVLDSLNSRRDAVVLNAIRAAVVLLRKPVPKDVEIRDRLASLLTDSDASHEVRNAALNALLSLEDQRLTAFLSAAANDVSLEGSQLLIRVETALETRPARP